MYRRYSQGNPGGVSISQMKRSRLKDLIILVLAALLIAGAVFCIPLLQKQDASRTIYIQRMQSECDDALRQTSSLSRNAGADSAAILARIRSNLYAVRTVNVLSTAQGNGVLVDEDRLMTLQNTVDRYLEYLTTGMDTGEYVTSLQTSFAELQEILGNLN